MLNPVERGSLPLFAPHFHQRGVSLLVSAGPAGCSTPEVLCPRQFGRSPRLIPGPPILGVQTREGFGLASAYPPRQSSTFSVWQLLVVVSQSTFADSTWNVSLLAVTPEISNVTEWLVPSSPVAVLS